MVNNHPLVSIVIPTYGRPHYLLRAIQSALGGSSDPVEVIVVPNGPDTKWREVLAPLRVDPRVRVSPVESIGVSAARNHGMSLARGKYLRFLDDDDYLLPAAVTQLEMIEQTGADVCSGLIANVDEDGIGSGVNGAPATDDFVCAVTELSGFRLPHGNLWRRSAVQDSLWDITIHEGEDYVWTLDLAAAREWQWIRIPEPVGVWFQHRGPRGSSVGRSTNRRERVLSHLFGLHEQLSTKHRLTTSRRLAIANALWHYVHEGFPSHPIYWSRVARRALAMDPASRPSERFYTEGPFRALQPLLGEWILLPVRYLTRTVRDVPKLWRGHDYRRKL